VQQKPYGSVSVLPLVFAVCLLFERSALGTIDFLERRSNRVAAAGAVLWRDALRSMTYYFQEQDQMGDTSEICTDVRRVHKSLHRQCAVHAQLSATEIIEFRQEFRHCAIVQSGFKLRLRKLSTSSTSYLSGVSLLTSSYHQAERGSWYIRSRVGIDRCEDGA
jgi:hypothetical protein